MKRLFLLGVFSVCSAVYLAAGLKRLESYVSMIGCLVKHYEETRPGTVFEGDTEAFEAFKEHIGYFTPEQGNAGIFYLHPNKEGACKLGEYWGKAIMNVL